MNTRRIPFQFSTTDPLARQRELEKRFGLQPTCPKMYVDVNNPLSMDSIPKETSSPRFQHRVPIFAEGYDHPVHSSSVDSMASVPENKKPNVRVIPIEVEGDSRSPRHRTFSGPADTLKDRCDNQASDRIDRFPFKRYNFEDIPKATKPKLSSEPRVYNIPIQVEGANDVSKNSQPKAVPKSPTPKPKIIETPKPKNATPVTSNGCSQSKLSSKAKPPQKDKLIEKNEKQDEQPKNNVEIALKKIEDILTEFKSYETAVAEFTGTSKDKQYRYLDEMLTRCMLRLDDIDTMGNEEIRLSRKNAVKKVQASIDLLESKANVQPVTSAEVTEVQLSTGENVDEKGDSNDIEMQDSAVTSAENESSDQKEMDLPSSNTNDVKASDSMSNRVGESSQGTSENTNNVADVEMNEISQEKVDGIIQDKENSTVPLTESQNNMPEAEMAEGISLDKVNSESVGSDKNAVENGHLSGIATDVEMVEDSASVEVKESPSLEKSAGNASDVNKLNEVSEVEMVDLQDVSSKESDSNDRETIEKPDHNSECSELKTNDELNDAISFEDSSNKLDVDHKIGDQSISALPKQHANCASNQSEKTENSEVN